MKNPARHVWIVGLVVAAACQSPAPRTEDTEARSPAQEAETFPPAVAARLDSGNVAFANGDLADALRQYQAAAEAAPGIPATWFGVYMAHHALGNQEAADSALARAREQVPGSTLLRNGSAETAHK